MFLTWPFGKEVKRHIEYIRGHLLKNEIFADTRLIRDRFRLLNRARHKFKGTDILFDRDLVNTRGTMNTK